MPEQPEQLQTSYDSIAAAAAAMGVTVKQLRRAKKEGAPGYRGSRVYPAELLPWLEARGSVTLDEKEALELKRLRLNVEDSQLELDRKKGLLWDSDVVKQGWLSHMRAARQVLISISTGLAPQLAGHPVLEIERRLQAAMDGALEKLRNNPFGDGQFCCPHCRQSISAEDIRHAKANEGDPQNNVSGRQEPAGKSETAANRLEQGASQAAGEVLVKAAAPEAPGQRGESATSPESPAATQAGKAEDKKGLGSNRQKAGQRNRRTPVRGRPDDPVSKVGNGVSKNAGGKPGQNQRKAARTKPRGDRRKNQSTSGASSKSKAPSVGADPTGQGGAAPVPGGSGQL